MHDHPTIDLRLLRYAKHPCPFHPGSPRKIAVLTLRASLGAPLFVAGDYGDGRRPERSPARHHRRRMPAAPR